MILSTLVTSTVLTIRREKVNVVAANKILGEIDDGLCEGGFTMVICSVFRDVTDKLSDLETGP